MAKFKVLGGSFGEGWQPGEIIEMDKPAASVRLANGELELVESKEVSNEAPKKRGRKKKIEEN